MDTDQITQEIERIIEALDMGAKGCAKAMGISVQAFRNKKSQGSHRDKFNEKNLQDLIRYIKEVSSKLMTKDSCQ